MASYLFGSGYLFLRDTVGNVQQVGVLQDVSINTSAQSKELRGSTQYPLAVAISARKIEGTAKNAKIDGKLIASMLGQSSTSGRTYYSYAVPFPFAATVAVTPVGTGFVEDLGVLDAQNNPMTLTASTPAVGSYTVTGGSYTFNASQTGTGSFSWSYLTGSGSSFTIQNKQMGLAPTFQVTLVEQGQQVGTGLIQQFGLQLNAVTVPKLSLAFKNEDFTTENLSFEAGQDSLGNIGVINFE